MVKAIRTGVSQSVLSEKTDDIFISTLDLIHSMKLSQPLVQCMFMCLSILVSFSSPSFFPNSHNSKLFSRNNKSYSFFSFIL